MALKILIAAEFSHLRCPHWYHWLFPGYRQAQDDPSDSSLELRGREVYSVSAAVLFDPVRGKY
jgi:hypothetical protein